MTLPIGRAAIWRQASLMTKNHESAILAAAFFELSWQEFRHKGTYAKVELTNTIVTIV